MDKQESKDSGGEGTTQRFFKERLDKLMRNIIIIDVPETCKEIVYALLKMLAKFKSTDINRLSGETGVDKDKLKELILGVKYRTSKGEEIQAFQISLIREMIEGIYLSDECGKDI